MPETKQISATINIDIANDVAALANEEKRSFSQMVEILLTKALLARTLPRTKPLKDKIK